jgi:hypothetical protein
MKRLSIALKIIAIVFVVVFGVFYILVLANSSLVAEGSLIGMLLRWEPYNKAYEGMIVTIFVVWGIMLWQASKNPSEHKSLIDFTIWGNLAHAGMMLVASLLIKGEVIHAVGDVLVLALIGLVVLWLRPRRVASA